MLNGLDLFSGIGGFALALREWVKPVAYCEIDRFAQAVLLSRMRGGQLPIAPIWDDVRTLSGKTLLGSIDVITAGFPCTDISESGPGDGLAGERSKLFFEVYRLAKEIKPTFIFLENVRAITSRGLDVIGEDLASLGYDCRWEVIPAYIDPSCFEGERWFCLAKASGERRQAKRPAKRNASAPSIYTSPIHTPFQSQNAGEFFDEPDGLSIWTHSVRALGLAVVPHQARESFQRLMGLKKPI